MYLYYYCHYYFYAPPKRNAGAGDVTYCMLYYIIVHYIIVDIIIYYIISHYIILYHIILAGDLPRGALRGACDTTVTGVCEKHIPPEKKTGWKFSFENTESGAGLQLLLLGRMAKARVKGVVCSQTPVAMTMAAIITVRMAVTVMVVGGADDVKNCFHC